MQVSQQLSPSPIHRFFLLIREHPWITVCVSGSCASTIYAAAAHFPLSEPVIISAAAVDLQIPFVPGAAWPYASYIFLLPALVLFASKLASFGRVLFTAISTALLNAAVYVVWPTALDVRTEAPAGTLLAVIQGLDTTLCAVPSGHVSLPMAITIGALLASSGVGEPTARRWRRLAAGFFLWTAVLAASTVLTKQHYAIDVVAGALFGMAMGISVAAIRFRSSVGEERTQSSRAAPPLDSVAGGCV